MPGCGRELSVEAPQLCVPRAILLPGTARDEDGRQRALLGAVTPDSQLLGGITTEPRRSLDLWVLTIPTYEVL